MPLASQRSYTFRINDLIDPVSTKDFDVVPFAGFAAVKYIISVFSSLEGKYRISEIFAVRTGADITDQLIYKSSSGPKVLINVLRSGSDAFLRLVNQESYPVEVSIVKIII